MANEGPTTITGEVGATGTTGKRIIDVTPTLGTSIGRSVKSIPAYNISQWIGDQLANYRMWHVATFSHTASDCTESIYYLGRAEFDSANGFMTFMKYDSNGQPQFIKQIGQSSDGANLMPVDMQVDLVSNRIFVLGYGTEVRTAPLESYQKYFIACYNLDFNTGTQLWQRWVGVDDNNSPGTPTSMTLSATGEALYIAGWGLTAETIAPGYGASFVMALDVKNSNPTSAKVKPLWFNAYKSVTGGQQGQDTNKDIAFKNNALYVTGNSDTDAAGINSVYVYKINPASPTNTQWNVAVKYATAGLVSTSKAIAVSDTDQVYVCFDVADTSGVYRFSGDNGQITYYKKIYLTAPGSETSLGSFKASSIQVTTGSYGGVWINGCYEGGGNVPVLNTSYMYLAKMNLSENVTDFPNDISWSINVQMTIPYGSVAGGDIGTAFTTGPNTLTFAPNSYKAYMVGGYNFRQGNPYNPVAVAFSIPNFGSRTGLYDGYAYGPTNAWKWNYSEATMRTVAITSLNFDGLNFASQTKTNNIRTANVYYNNFFVGGQTLTWYKSVIWPV